jgi:hypothetical protein
MPPLLDPSWVSEARRCPRCCPRGSRGTARVSCGPPLRVTHGPLHRHHRTSCQRSSSVNLTGKPNVVRKNRRSRRLWHRVQQLAHPGAVVGFRIRHREITPPSISAACPGPRVDEHTERSSAAPKIGSARAIPPIGLDVQRSQVASRPGNDRVRPVVIADIDHDRDGPASRVAIFFSAEAGLVRIFPAHRGDRGCGSGG